MSVVLLDSCVITDLTDPTGAWFEWSAETLDRLDEAHSFVINPVIYAECSIGYETLEEFEKLLTLMELDVRGLSREALFLAGRAFLSYRRQRGVKTNVLPDFFIGAHAAVEGYKLLTRDKRRFAHYFPTVELIMPPTEKFCQHGL